jgi:hypothetical protein
MKNPDGASRIIQLQQQITGQRLAIERDMVEVRKLSKKVDTRRAQIKRDEEELSALRGDV